MEVAYDDSRPHHGKLPVGLHEVFEECLRGVSKGDMYVDDIQLPRWAYQFICRYAAFYSQVVVDVYLDLTFVEYGHSLDPRGALLVSCPDEDGG